MLNHIFLHHTSISLYKKLKSTKTVKVAQVQIYDDIFILAGLATEIAQLFDHKDEEDLVLCWVAATMHVRPLYMHVGTGPHRHSAQGNTDKTALAS
jgi:hypothetical protein